MSFFFKYEIHAKFTLPDCPTDFLRNAEFALGHMGTPQYKISKNGKYSAIQHGFYTFSNQGYLLARTFIYTLILSNVNDFKNKTHMATKFSGHQPLLQ